MSFLVAALISTSHAGWLRDWCERYLIEDDPYQYETASREWVEQQIEQLSLKEQWGNLTRNDASQLRILRREIRVRDARGM